ncbi:MAG: septum formation protein Maf [Saprospiraceae bacterium]|nr:septum formation protein Maf [Saprospiraceae bacterium]
MKIFEQKIILASKSPRRKQLLEIAGFNFEVKALEVDESFSPTMPVAEVAAYLAEKKADAAHSLVDTNALILAADSVVILEDKIYGKPEDETDAKQILRQLSGKVHRVITGVCLLQYNKKRIFSGVSEVHFAPLSEEEIEYYVQKYQPYDKAGAYGIQDWIGWCKVLKIEGSYSNVMGLPMELVYKELSSF